ncbi:ABC transporter ATP-binding protein [Nocardia jinanensis]|uniref:ABC transporter ATP-binding protein n=1 Tax=Nocardia jinanensis TaxID=382504 RepID=A0A917VXV8_9NOCA|nr:ABC transporter ATP-binding protein [Nocardia jinanensis]GGL34737.1 ABC transporter ATP-binding protein [Nocardia jinanensis]
MTLNAQNLFWSRAGNLVVDDVTVQPEIGQTVGLLGPNGSGKSSLLRLLAGISRPDRGEVTLDGTPLRRLGRRPLARRIAMVGQHAHTDVDITVHDVVRLGRIPHRDLFGQDPDEESAIARALRATGLADHARRTWSTLSGGERQRAQIARALAQEPGELLLDEPTNHLDIAHQLDILDLVTRLPVTTVVALHDLNLAAMFCDYILVLDRGGVAAHGTPAETLTERLVRDVYGVDATITIDDGVPVVRYRRSAVTPGTIP